jgi:hypothetical protein
MPFVQSNANKTNSTYISPALRAKNSSPLAAAAPSTKKTALKKEFALEPTAFPSLGDVRTPANRGTPISFSSAAAKKIEAPKAAVADVLPGWVHIRKHLGKIEYKYGKAVLRYDDEERAEQILSQIIVKNRIAREHYDRTRDIERLGDLSEFYGQPTLAELYENEFDAAPYADINTESSDDSDYSE